MNAENALVGRVYFEGDVQMPVPPEYFLQRLYDYDALLVMFASRTRPGCYVIARRLEHTPGLRDQKLAEIANPDTRQCMAMGWVPVCMMVQSGTNWLPDQLIARLVARDIRANGGADKVADMLEAQEDAEKAAQQKAIRDDLWNRSGDGWRTYQARTGQSTIQFHGEVKAPVKETTVQLSPPLEAQQDRPQPVATVGGEV